MKYKITGDNLQLVTVELSAGEKVYGEAGTMVYMSSILERLYGEGTAFIHACGDFVEFDLQSGQRMKVDTGSVVGWDGTVDYDIERVKGIKTMFFGGEGLFLTTLTGPGKIIIQSMTLHNLASALSPFLPSARGTSGTSGSSGVVGTLLKETIGR